MSSLSLTVHVCKEKAKVVSGFLFCFVVFVCFLLSSPHWHGYDAHGVCCGDVLGDRRHTSGRRVGLRLVLSRQSKCFDEFLWGASCTLCRLICLAFSWRSSQTFYTPRLRPYHPPPPPPLFPILSPIAPHPLDFF